MVAKEQAVHAMNKLYELVFLGVKFSEDAIPYSVNPNDGIVSRYISLLNHLYVYSLLIIYIHKTLLLLFLLSFLHCFLPFLSTHLFLLLKVQVHAGLAFSPLSLPSLLMIQLIFVNLLFHSDSYFCSQLNEIIL